MQNNSSLTFERDNNEEFNVPSSSPLKESSVAKRSNPVVDGNDMAAQLNILLNEFPDFSNTLVQAIFKSNSFDTDLSRTRLLRIKKQRDNWSHTDANYANMKNARTNLDKSTTDLKPAGTNTTRFSSLNNKLNTTKIMLNKNSSNSIFNKYSHIVKNKPTHASNINNNDFSTKFYQFNGEKKRKLIRSDQMPKKNSELEKAKERLLKKKTESLMDKESDSENDESDENLISDDDDGAEYEESTTSTIDLNKQILNFLNTANPLDISDLADTTYEKGQLIVDRRPYTSLVLFNDMDFLTEDETSKRSSVSPSPTPGSTSSATRARGRRGTPRNQKKEGEKFLEKISEAIKGYNAIESLLKKCSSYGDSIFKQISKWGIDVDQNGTNDDAGLDIMVVDDDEDNADTVVDGFDEEDIPKDETKSDETKVDEIRTDEIKTDEKDKIKSDLVKPDNSKEEEDEDEEEEYKDDEDDEYDDHSDHSDDEEFINEDEDEEDDEDEIKFNRPGRISSNHVTKYFKGKPILLAKDIELKDYQQTGINWLNLLYHNKLSCILADDMGLGKTCQVISFLAYLKQIKQTGPHLIVVPSSTLENWLREFSKFCPSIRVEPYYGSLQERAELREALQKRKNQYDVIVTTYNLAAGNKYDVAFLRNSEFNVVVYDEGHMLKNSMSERFNKLMKIRGNFRLLLTGTPLQNNLRELMSLLEFIMPSLFISKKESLASIFKQKAKTTDDNQGHNPLLVQNAINRAKTMMKPFILRRKKDQVLKHLPAKHSKIATCTMTKTQREIYDNQIVQMKEYRRSKVEGRKVPNNTSKNLIMSLRKASIHPLLFRHIYDDKKIDKMSKAILKEPAYAIDGNKQYIMEDMSVMSDLELHKLACSFPDTLSRYQLGNEEWMQSGKVDKLREILEDVIVKKQEKILIFSLFTQVLDILEFVLATLGYKFLRLDGSTQVNERQSLIDKFYEDKTIPVFILSTKAGGFGINLVCANHVVIFDQSFNPHDDRQAADRSHRVGQTKEVYISTLVTEDSIEEQIHQLAKNKLALDVQVSEDDKNTQNKLETRVSNILEDIIMKETET